MPPSKAEARLGLTPLFLRIAHGYLRLGEGVYLPPNHPHYNRVTVTPLYDFTENPTVPGEYAEGTVVTFYQGEHRVKFVEFRSQVVGGGGDSLLREV